MLNHAAMTQLARTIVDKLGWIVAALAAGFLAFTIAEPLRMNWGDPWTDCNALITGHFFDKYGFLKLAFTPIIDIEPLNNESLRYTHYPPLPDIMNGVQQRIHGELDLSYFRAPAIVLSLYGLLLLHRYVAIIWGRTAASVTVAFFAGNFLWVQYADTINHIPLYWTTGFGAMLCAAHWLREKRHRHLALAGVLTFACFLSSYDFIFFVPLMIAATPSLLGQRFWTADARRLFYVVAVGATASIVVKYLLVIWAVGWPQFYSDLIFQFHERATTKHGGDYKGGLARIFVFRLWRFFTPVFFGMLALQVLLLGMKLFARSRAKELSDAKWSASPLLVLVAGIPFVVVFSELFCEQYHPTLILLPYYAISAGVTVARCWESRHAALRGLALGMVFLGLAWQVNELALLEKTFLTRSDVARVRALLDAKDKHRFFVSNGVAVAPSLYYWNRYLLGITYIPPASIPRYINELQDQFGDEPIRYVHFSDIEKSVNDKYLYGIFVNQKKWDWIADPMGHASEWMPFVRETDRKVLELVSQFSELELDTGTTRVYRIDRASIDAFFGKKVLASPTTFVDFGDQSSEMFKVYGVRFPEKNPEGIGFTWLHRRQRQRYKFTLQGLRTAPEGPSYDESALRVNMPAGRSYRIDLTMQAGIPEEMVTVSVNDSAKLAEYVFEKTDSGEMSVEVPAEVLAPSGLQVLHFAMSKINPDGVGVGLRTMRIVPH